MVVDDTSPATCRTSMTHLYSLLLSYRPSKNGRLGWSGMLGTGLSVIDTLSCVQVVSVGEASPVSLVFQDHEVPLVQLVRLVIKFR